MRILWLKTELLHPIDKGGKIRTYQMLKELKKNHHITYLTLDDGSAEDNALEKSAEYAHETIVIPHRTAAKFSAKFYFELARNTTSELPYFMKKYVSAAMGDAIEKQAKRENFDVVICDFLVPAVNMPQQVEIPTVLFQHNVEAMIWRRHFEVQKNSVKKLYLKNQWRKSFDYERETCRKFDFVVAVSSEDAEMMRNDYGIENVADVPTGVDTEFFKRDDAIEKDEFNLVFTGSMDWLPNEDAIDWFAREIYPLVKEKIPQVSLTVVGRNPFPSLVEMGRKDPSIVVTGRVADVRPFMNKASVYVVPLRIGGGTRLKIYEAMAMRLPVVSTSVGAEGLPVEDGKEILLRDTPREFAEAVVEQLTDKIRAEKIGAQAEKTVRENFGWKTVADVFAEICENTIEMRKEKTKGAKV
ncbi:MAG: glycosyltransferase [Acidobacteria bacterium]|nr:glycosyltransferase [Acidobacteriota bacterium]